MKKQFRGQGLVVVGGQWGDEGKGRIVDALAEDCDIIVRFQGGNNAGHSLHIGDTSVVLHLIPCGIMRRGKLSIIGNGVVIDPQILFEEISLLKKHNVDCSPQALRIANNAHIILPHHKIVDEMRENRAEGKIGTTKRGIGPCYEDKVARFGIRAKDLTTKDLLAKKLKNALDNRGHLPGLSFDEIFFEAWRYGEKLAPYLVDVGEILEQSLRDHKRVLFEGAQGSLLDVDHGTYPFVTSSNCVAAQAAIGSGIGSGWLSEILLVTKAYCTRVGEGPFFTEVSSEEQEHFRRLGNEFGATTGRPRRCGWLDLPALKYAARINGATGLVLTKIDILAQMERIKVARSYKKDGQSLGFLSALDRWSASENFAIDYVELQNSGTMPKNISSLNDLPSFMRDLCKIIEDDVNLPIRMISFGRERGQEVWI